MSVRWRYVPREPAPDDAPGIPDLAEHFTVSPHFGATDPLRLVPGVPLTVESPTPFTKYAILNRQRTRLYIGLDRTVRVNELGDALLGTYDDMHPGDGVRTGVVNPPAESLSLVALAGFEPAPAYPVEVHLYAGDPALDVPVGFQPLAGGPTTVSLADQEAVRSVDVVPSGEMAWAGSAWVPNRTPTHLATQWVSAAVPPPSVIATPADPTVGRLRVLRFLLGMAANTTGAAAGGRRVRLLDGATAIAQPLFYIPAAVPAQAFGIVTTGWIDLGPVGHLCGVGANLSLDCTVTPTGGEVFCLVAYRDEDNS